jgi:hypothetical protein
LGLNLARLLASAWISCQPLFIGGLMEIKVTCRGADLLPLEKIHEFQGELKKRSKKDIELIITSILKFGFSFPFFVWKKGDENYCLDGHGRIQALRELRKRGEEIPMLPVVYIEAKDDAEAKQKILRLNSQYGLMTKGSVKLFVSGMDFEVEEIQLPGGVLNFDEKHNIEQREVQFPEILGEENNYIVLKFDTDIDFLNIQTLLKLKTVRSYSTSTKGDNGVVKVGIGRVVDGVKAIAMIRGEM